MSIRPPGRPAHAIPPIIKGISIPSDLVQKVDTVLRSESDASLYGTWSRYIAGLIRADLERRGILSV